MYSLLQKHHYHELTIETQQRLGPIPNSFMRYWIDRFPRLLSHSYHALQSCWNEPIFAGYFSKNYVFTKPNYFYEETEDFKPFDSGSKSRDSPKQYRYKPMNYPNFVMDRKNGMKSQNNGMMNTNDGNSTNFNRNNKKGSYNFHNRLWNNVQNNSKIDSNENFRNIDNSRVQSIDEIPNDDTKFDKNENANEIRRTNEIFKDKPLENVWNIDNAVKEDTNRLADDEKMAEKMDKKKVEDRPECQGHAKKDENQKQNDKSISNKKKAKTDSTAPKQPVEVDDDGFTRVKYRNHSGSKKHKNSENLNENVNWIVPGRENKEQK